MQIKDIFNRSLKKGTPSSLFIIGILNGFLPCGLVYIAIAGAIAMGDVFLAALYMFLFGLGTSPAMFGMSLVGNFFNLELRRKFSRLIPVFGVILVHPTQDPNHWERRFPPVVARPFRRVGPRGRFRSLALPLPWVSGSRTVPWHY